jgi:hypothetical protein
MGDALADLDAVLMQQPDLASNLFLRGVIRSHRADAAGSRRTSSPRLQ